MRYYNVTFGRESNRRQKQVCPSPRVLSGGFGPVEPFSLLAWGVK